MLGREAHPSRGSFEVASRAGSRHEGITELRCDAPSVSEPAFDADETVTRPLRGALGPRGPWGERLAWLRGRLQDRGEAFEAERDETTVVRQRPRDSIPCLTSDLTLEQAQANRFGFVIPDLSRWLRVELLGVVLGLTALLVIASLPGRGVAEPLRGAHGNLAAAAATTLDDALSAALFGGGLSGVSSSTQARRLDGTAVNTLGRTGKADAPASVVSGAHLVILFHATDAVRPLYERALQSRVPGAELRIVNSPFGVFASGYRHLMAHLRVQYGTHYLDAVARHLGIESLAKYETITLASFSAGYAAVRTLLDEPASAALIDGVVAIDSWHSEFDPDGSPRDSQLAGLARFAKSAIAEPRICWLRHTDVRVPRRAPRVFASTSQVAGELRRLTGIPADGEDVAVGGLRVSAVDLHTDDHAEHVAALMVWGDDWLADALVALLERRARS